MRCCRSGKLTEEFASIPIRVRCNKNSQYGNTTKEANAGAKKWMRSSGLLTGEEDGNRMPAGHNPGTVPTRSRLTTA